MGDGRWAMGYGLWAMGDGLLAIGDWQDKRSNLDSSGRRITNLSLTYH